MKKQNIREKARRLTALGLGAVTALGCIIPCGAAGPDDGVVPLYDEAYYATTDYYGALTNGSVVKSYTTNGVEEIRDYGRYDEIKNLTDGSNPVTAPGETRFTFPQGAVPDHFYFEGRTTAPFQELPWTISVHYTLNGLPAKAEDLAGEKGVVEILIDALPNPNASEYARYNYTLEAAALFNQDDILSLEAPGAQVQLVGNLRAVLFLGLPGEECHYTIRVGAEKFAFGGMTFLMVPATLSQLEEIARLGERKDQLEEDYHRLSGSIDVLLNSLDGMSGSLRATASGLDQLNAARGTLSEGKGQVYEDLDALRGDLGGLSAALDPVGAQIDAASGALTKSHQVLGVLTEEITSLRTELKDLEELMEDVVDHRPDTSVVEKRLKDVRRDLEAVQQALNTLSAAKLPQVDPLFEGKSPAQLRSALGTAQSLHQAYAAGNGGDALNFSQFILSALLAKGLPAPQARATAASLSQFYATSYGLFASAEEAFAAVMQQSLAAGADPETAQAAAAQAAQAWGTVDAMLSAFRAAGGTEENPLDFYAFLYAVLLVKGQPNAGKDAESLGLLYDLYEAEPKLTELMIGRADQINGKVEELNGELKQAGRLMHELTEPSARLLGSLAALTGELDGLEDLLDDGETLAGITGETAGKGQKVLDQIDALYQVLNDYEPTAVSTLETVKGLTTSAAATVEDTGALLTSGEEVLQAAGTQLDDGTRKTLEGLAASLRAAANSLGKVGDVKVAKQDISAIIEDTWDEFTGETSNLLLMDATAPAQSLTDSRNPSPTSVQVLIRTQEIKAEETQAEDFAPRDQVQTTFWQRVCQMFRDFWSAVTGIFH